MRAGLTFRLAQPADAESLGRACFPQLSAAQVEELVARAESLWRCGRGAGVVACLEGQIVGFGQVTLWARVAEISDLSVTETQRGRGIGTALIQRLIALGAQRRNLIEIGVAHSNARALALYRRLGFRHARTLLLDLGQGIEPVHYLILSVNDHASPLEDARLPLESERDG